MSSAADAVYSRKIVNSWSQIIRDLETYKEKQSVVENILLTTLGQLKTLHLPLLGKRPFPDDVDSNKSKHFELTCIDVKTHFPSLLSMCAFFTQKFASNDNLCRVTVEIILTVICFLKSNSAFQSDPVVDCDTVRSTFVDNEIMNRAITDALLQEVFMKKTPYYSQILRTLCRMLPLFKGVWLQISISNAIQNVLQQDASFVPDTTPVDDEVVARSEFMYSLVCHPDFVVTDSDVSGVLRQCCRMLLACMYSKHMYTAKKFHWSWKIIQQLCFSHGKSVNRYINHLDFLFVNVQKNTVSPQKTSLAQFLLSGAGLAINTFPIRDNEQKIVIVNLEILTALVRCTSPEVRKSLTPHFMSSISLFVECIQKSVENHQKIHPKGYIHKVHQTNYNTICELAQRFSKRDWC